MSGSWLASLKASGCEAGNILNYHATGMQIRHDYNLLVDQTDTATIPGGLHTMLFLALSALVIPETAPAFSGKWSSSATDPNKPCVGPAGCYFHFQDRSATIGETRAASEVGMSYYGGVLFQFNTRGTPPTRDAWCTGAIYPVPGFPICDTFSSSTRYNLGQNRYAITTAASPPQAVWDSAPSASWTQSQSVPYSSISTPGASICALVRADGPNTGNPANTLWVYSSCQNIPPIAPNCSISTPSLTIPYGTVTYSSLAGGVSQSVNMTIRCDGAATVVLKGADTDNSGRIPIPVGSGDITATLDASGPGATQQPITPSGVTMTLPSGAPTDILVRSTLSTGGSGPVDGTFNASTILIVVLP